MGCGMRSICDLTPPGGCACCWPFKPVLTTEITETTERNHKRLCVLCVLCGLKINGLELWTSRCTQWPEVHSKFVPELPDVAVYIEALAGRIVGRRLERVLLRSPFVLRSVEPL